MFTIEEEGGTYTGSLRRHNGYYAGDFTRTPQRTLGVSELRPPIFPTKCGNAD